MAQRAPGPFHPFCIFFPPPTWIALQLFSSVVAKQLAWLFVFFSLVCTTTVWQPLFLQCKGYSNSFFFPYAQLLFTPPSPAMAQQLQQFLLFPCTAALHAVPIECHLTPACEDPCSNTCNQPKPLTVLPYSTPLQTTASALSPYTVSDQ